MFYPFYWLLRMIHLLIFVDFLLERNTFKFLLSVYQWVIIYESKSDGHYNFQPKKSWEGFIGGGILTLIWGFIFAAFLAQFPLLICPVRLDVNWHVMSTCDAPEHFIPQDYTIPLVMRPLTSVLGFGSQVAIRPFQFHIVALGLFYIQYVKPRVLSSHNPWNHKPFLN